MMAKLRLDDPAALTNPKTKCRKAEAMADARPIGFRDYVRSNGFHTVYLITPVFGAPVKIGISEDPIQRLGTIQAGHYEELVFHRFWWLPGIAISSKIEADFKREHAEHNIRGEWFDMMPEQAEALVNRAISEIGVWNLTQSEMEFLYDDWYRQTNDLPKHAPCLLPGRPPSRVEPWDKPKKTYREPYRPTNPW